MNSTKSAPLMFVQRSKPTSKVRNLTLTSVLLLALAVCLCSLVVADSEPNSGVHSGGDSGQSNEQFAPKRQYFIAPRIGRSMSTSGNGQSRSRPNIWSAMEEASVLAPGQIQPIRGYPGPLRSSLNRFLLASRRLNERSAAGLLPQARIGRRASPSGLLPQPRVGRRSAGLVFEYGQQQQDEISSNEIDSLDGVNGAGQQEVAVAAMSDNAALNDAVESLMSGRR